MTTTGPLNSLFGLLPPDRRLALLDRISPDEQAALEDDSLTVATHLGPRRDQIVLKAFRPTHPDERYQIPPEGDWRVWLFLGGRGTGKTQSVAVQFYDHMMGPPCIPGIPGGHLGAIIGPTLGDVSTSAVGGASGLKTLDSRIREVTRKGGTIVVFPNGAIAKEFGAHTAADVERLRSGGNTCVAWAEELAAWTAIGYDNDAWDLMQTGLRLGPRPQVFASTTPKPKPLIRELVKLAKDGDRRTVVTGGTMYDNADNLAPDFIDEMESLYKGTRVEAQELLGLLLDHVEGALWTPDAIDADRIGVDQVPPLLHVTIGVDPAFSDEDAADEAGIITVGLGTPAGTRRLHAYVLEDQSCRGGFVWPTRAVERWRHFHDDAARGAKTVTESNLGGKNFLTKMLKAVDSSVVVGMVNASVGKRTRAEPVALLYDKHVVHHVGTHALLEQEMTTWVPGDKSPNRLDALVWALEDVRQQLVGSPARVGSARTSGAVMPSRIGAS